MSAPKEYGEHDTEAEAGPLAHLSAAVDNLESLDPQALSDAELREMMVGLLWLQARLAEVRSQMTA